MLVLHDKSESMDFNIMAINTNDILIGYIAAGVAFSNWF